MVVLGLALWRRGIRAGAALLALVVAQVATGLSNVVLQWPLVAALLHSGGAAALVFVLTALALRLPAARPTADQALMQRRRRTSISRHAGATDALGVPRRARRTANSRRACN